MARSRRWVVDATSPRDLTGVVAAMKCEPEAIVQGRVFVGRKRVTDAGRRLVDGEVVEVFLASAKDTNLVATVLDRRGGMLAMFKPAGMPTVPDHRGSDGSLQAAVAALEGFGDVSAVHPTSRLDLEVSGVVVFALDPGARNVLREAREQGRYARHYVAISLRVPSPDQGVIDAPIGRASDPRRRCVAGIEAAPSTSHYRVVAKTDRGALIAVEPATGRTHQIRVHMAHVGAPLLGDDLYGGARTIVGASGAVKRVSRVALHAAWVRIGLPSGETWKVDAPVPQEIEQLWKAIGGDQGAWEEALRGR
jgi:23S rRNA pseudouridine1911/1915/1917 synthase